MNHIIYRDICEGCYHLTPSRNCYFCNKLTWLIGEDSFKLGSGNIFVSHNEILKDKCPRFKRHSAFNKLSKI